MPSLSLYDVKGNEPLQLNVRLAGTRLRDYLGLEITGRMLADFDLGDQRAYWEAAYEEVLAGARPAQGVVQMTPWGKPEIFQFWLRLPLMDENANIVMILGHDAFLQSEKARALVERSSVRTA